METTKEEVLRIILDTKVIAVIRMADANKVAKVVAAIQAGGVKAIEITMTTPGALDEIRIMSSQKIPGVIIGAGTVLDSETAASVIRAGADFVVSPILNEEMIRLCRQYGKLVVPGALTPTEIIKAWDAGADIVKIFPATSVGPRYFKDLKGPLPQVRLMPTGGVDLENAAEFIRNGACCVGIGTALLDKKAIQAGDWMVLTKKAAELITSVQNVWMKPIP
ncbi:MAG: bifunctional 4-hydroxy-2-oxoglutarate aldolase/2-dehydro-3-deoxy-phosphogluconate aldolase [Candidatus Aminicenantes bacterium]|nr:bifunctional 4-hydroxy-2-oxoglutarate aldolase/2-dehydro-3-deoxy-phosphogluconate aldolase [Candidatus Aminicenantes bacterium]